MHKDREAPAAATASGYSGANIDLGVRIEELMSEDQQAPADQAAPTEAAPPPPAAPSAPAASYPPPPPAAMGAPAGTAGLTLPAGVELASRGRRVGAFFLAIPLSIVTLGIGYLIWGIIAWGKGTSPALQVLGMKAWKPAEQKPATWGTMALRNIVGGIVQGILSIITELISFVMFLTDDQNRTLPDRIGGTVIVHDPGKVLG
jgi:hypothetical protein